MGVGSQPCYLCPPLMQNLTGGLIWTREALLTSTAEGFGEPKGFNVWALRPWVPKIIHKYFVCIEIHVMWRKKKNHSGNFPQLLEEAIKDAKGLKIARHYWPGSEHSKLCLRALCSHYIPPGSGSWQCSCWQLGHQISLWPQELPFMPNLRIMAAKPQASFWQVVLSN